MKRLTLASCLLMLSLPAASAMTWDYYESIRGSGDAELYITGVGEGMGWANTRLEQNGQPILFCQPRDLAIQAEAYDAMLGDAIVGEPSLAQYPIELILLDALEQKYPCKRK